MKGRMEGKVFETLSTSLRFGVPETPLDSFYLFILPFWYGSGNIGDEKQHRLLASPPLRERERERERVETDVRLFGMFPPPPWGLLDDRVYRALSFFSSISID